MTIDWRTLVTDNAYGNTGAGQSHSIDRIYQGLLDRNADKGGMKYWKEKAAADIAGGGDGSNVYQSLADTIVKYDPHYSASQTYKETNPNWTSDDLKKLDTAYVSPFHAGSGSAAADWRPGDRLTTDIARAVATTESNPDGTQKLDADGNNIVKASYDDQTNDTVADVIAAINAKSGIDLTGTGIITGGNQHGSDILAALGLGGGDNTVTGGENTVTGGENTVTGGENTVTGGENTSTGGLSEADILALIAAHGGGTTTTTNNTTTGGGFDMDSFMQMMLMMNMMNMGGGGSQYGYGGVNPGGVSQAFDYKDMANWMKETFGSGSGSGTTASLNV